MRYLRAALRLLPGLLLAVTLVGCDSGGDGGNLGNDVTLQVEGASETSVSFSPSFAYGSPPEGCVSGSFTTSLDGTGNTGTVPIDETITPTSSEGDCPPEGTDATDFDGARIDVTVSGSADLTVRLLSNGNQIDETTESEQTGTVTTYTVEGGDFPDLSDFFPES